MVFGVMLVWLVNDVDWCLLFCVLVVLLIYGMVVFNLYLVVCVVIFGLIVWVVFRLVCFVFVWLLWIFVRFRLYCDYVDFGFCVRVCL